MGRKGANKFSEREVFIRNNVSYNEVMNNVGRFENKTEENILMSF